MAPQASSVTTAGLTPVAERRRLFKRESLRDFAGVAIGVAVGALVWIAFLSLLRIPV